VQQPGRGVGEEIVFYTSARSSTPGIGSTSCRAPSTTSPQGGSLAGRSASETSRRTGRPGPVDQIAQIASAILPQVAPLGSAA
jgi:hypothetical protein